ncbi:hypothetical protein HPB49_010365 [Dermacentor silvarum]|uniref:Uncharacterized protein n=1 Tax=Dermacentor silvarum TaxID=543639 RepID=A0ACB8DYQ9_DERSI|nr:hypothetical protein HPB49_010365 [Dermacentor silvarum]
MKLLSRDETVNRILFTDEKIFIIEPAWNSRNHQKLLPNGSSRTIGVEKKHSPRSIMVWGRISGLVKTKLVFVPKRVELNADIYHEMMLEDSVILCAQEN